MDNSAQRSRSSRDWKASPSVGGLLGDEGPGPLTVAWRDRWRVVAIAILTAGVSYGLSLQMPTVYAAETTLVFPYSGSEVALPGGDAERSRSLRTEAERITSFGLLQQAADELGGRLATDALLAQVEALPSANSDVITVRAWAATAGDAAGIADAVALVYRRQVGRRERRSISILEERKAALERRIAQQQEELADQISKQVEIADGDEAAVATDSGQAATRLGLQASVSQLSEVQAQLDQTTSEEESAIGRIQVLWPAQVPGIPEQPRPIRNAATAVILVLMAYVTIRWWRAEPDSPRINDAQAAETVLGVPVVAEIPPIRHPSSGTGIVLDDYPQIVDAYRMAAAMTPVRGSVLVTAASGDASGSSLVLNVGDVLRKDGYQVMLVEGDPQSRLRAHRRTRERGLTDLVVGHATVEQSLLQSVDAENRWIGLMPWGERISNLPRGPQSSVAHVITELSAIADLVLVDGPPLASSANALNLAANVDAILLVVTMGTTVADASRLRARLRQLDRPVLGLIVEHQAPPRRIRRRRVMTDAPRWAPVGVADRVVVE